jgi:hypothetical protein
MEVCNNIFSSIDMLSPSVYMTGEMVTSAAGAWSSRVSEKEKDPTGMGRWSNIMMVGKKNTKVAIITGNRCVWSSGKGSTWNQEKIFMRDQQNKQQPDPRYQFITNLINYIKAKQSQEHDIILCFNANEVIGDDTMGIEKLIWDCRFFDIMDVLGLEPDKQLKDAYKRGTNCHIDFLLQAQDPKTAPRDLGH